MTAGDREIVVRLLQPHMLSEVMRFGASQFEKSNYAPLKFNSVIARATLRDALRDKASRAFTAWRGQNCVGLLIGSVSPLPWCAGLWATDIVFIAEAGGDKLRDAFVAWAKSHRVARIDMGTSDTPRPGLDRFYEAGGLTKTGNMYYWQKGIDA